MSRVYGLHAVAEIVGVAPEAVARIVVAPGGVPSDVERLLEDARAAGITIATEAVSALRSRSGGRGGSRIAADLRVAGPPALEDVCAKGDAGPIVVILDGITDPHNFGAILRSSAAFGADLVIVGHDRSAPLNDAAARASAGAVAYVPVLRVVNLSRTLRQLRDQGIWILATTPAGGGTLWDFDLVRPLGLVIGAEGAGVRHGLLKASDATVRLPMPGPVSSLNASVFAGVVLAEAARQRWTQRALANGRGP